MATLQERGQTGGCVDAGLEDEQVRGRVDADLNGEQIDEHTDSGQTGGDVDGGLDNAQMDRSLDPDTGARGECADADPGREPPDNGQDAESDSGQTADFTGSKSGSLLVDSEIIALCSKGKLITSGYRRENVESVSYNLTIKRIITWKLKSPPKDPKDIQPDDVEIIYKSSVRLAPNETVFVSTGERLQMPPNIVGRIVERNSLMRIGLLVSGPQYQPGHNTSIFLRVCNLSNYDMELEEGDPIAQICFEFLSQAPQRRYGADKGDQYQGETDFAIPLQYIREHITEPSDLQQKMDNLEARIYTVVAAFIGAFVSVLSLLVVNFSALEGKSLEEIVVVNISLAVCITMILGIVLHFCRLLTGPPGPSK